MTVPVCDRTAVELAEDRSSGLISSVDLVRSCLERIAALNPALNAVCTLNPHALAEAAVSDQLRKAGEPLGLLDGIPFVAKDNLETRGLRTTFGSRLMAEYVPDEDAVSVERLHRAGAVLLGKTNTPEFAVHLRTDNLLFGPTRNPFDLRCSAGGSSGGTAAAIASGMAPIGLGTDLGGSIRMPAAMCGIVGLRPSPGRVPVYPTEFGWDTLIPHVQGPMARGVADLGLVLAALAGPDERDPTSLPEPTVDYALAGRAKEGVQGRRVAYCHDLGGLLPIDPEVGNLARAAARGFERLGCSVEEAAFDASDLMAIIAGTRGFGMIARYANRAEAAGGQMTRLLLDQLEEARHLDMRAVAEAERLRTRYWHGVRRLFERYDYIVAPTIGAPAFRLDEPLPGMVGGRPVARPSDVYRYTYAFTIVGLPVAAVPCGHTREGLPVGLQIVARRLADESALQAAAAFTALHPDWIAKPSTLHVQPQSAV
jgi:amidase